MLEVIFTDRFPRGERGSRKRQAEGYVTVERSHTNFSTCHPPNQSN